MAEGRWLDDAMGDSAEGHAPKMNVFGWIGTAVFVVVLIAGRQHLMGWWGVFWLLGVPCIFWGLDTAWYNHRERLIMERQQAPNS